MKVISKIVIQIALGVILISSGIWISITVVSAQESEGELSDTPYPVFGLDTLHTNRSIFKGPTTKPQIEWIASIPGSMGTDAVMPLSIGPDASVYLGISGYEGEGLYAFTSDGILKWFWTRPISQGVAGTAAIVKGGHLYINFGTHWPPDDYGLAKLSQADGTEVWTFQSYEGTYMSSPAVDQVGNIYFGGYDCQFRSVDSDGNLNWAYTAGSFQDGIVFASAAIGNDGTIYVGNEKWGAIALNPDGTVKWTAPLSDRPRFGPNILSSGVIVYRSQDGTVTAFNRDGQQLWSKIFSLRGGDATGAVAPNGTTLYIKTGASISGKLMALDGNTGSIQWEFDLSHNSNDAPVVGSDGIIYVSDRNSLLAINADGTELWNVSLDLGEPDHNFIASWPVIGGNGIIYVNLLEVWAYKSIVHIVRLLDPSNQPPEAICQDVTVSAESGLCTADASIDDGSFDPDGDDITLEQAPPGPYDLGDTDVTLTVTDDKGDFDTCDATVTVVDEEAPVISSVTANPNKLWPPNHKMVPVTVSVDASDNCDLACQIISIASNEPVNGLGDGDTAPDWIIADDLTVELRAERSGRGNGRIYTITVECTDQSGNSSTATETITVHNEKDNKIGLNTIRGLNLDGSDAGSTNACFISALF